MKCTSLALVVIGWQFGGATAVQQTPAPTTASAEVMPCAQARLVVDRLLDDATSRVETARQSNSAAALRAAADDLQRTLRDVRAQLAPCGAPTAAGPHAGHAAAQPDEAAKEAARIDEWLKGYDAAFIAKDLEKLATFYHPDVTIYEGAGVNNGWVDYRDRHLGPELKAFENLEFGHSNRRVHMLGDRAAYVISEYFIKAKMKERLLDSIGRETLVLEKQADGGWKIRHSHTSGRARPQK